MACSPAGGRFGQVTAGNSFDFQTHSCDCPFLRRSRSVCDRPEVIFILPWWRGAWRHSPSIAGCIIFYLFFVLVVVSACTSARSFDFTPPKSSNESSEPLVFCLWWLLDVWDLTWWASSRQCRGVKEASSLQRKKESMFKVYTNRYLWSNDIFSLHAALLLYCSDSLFVKCVVNVTKTLKQTKLHPGDSQLHVPLQQGRGPLHTKVPPPPC